MAGVLPATLRVASRSKIAPGDFVILCVLPAILRVASRSKIASGGFVNFRPLPPEGGAGVVRPYLSMRLNEQQMTKICC
jgi:hypothetical protein